MPEYVFILRDNHNKMFQCLICIIDQKHGLTNIAAFWKITIYSNIGQAALFSLYPGLVNKCGGFAAGCCEGSAKGCFSATPGGLLQGRGQATSWGGQRQKT